MGADGHFLFFIQIGQRHCFTGDHSPTGVSKRVLFSVPFQVSVYGQIRRSASVVPRPARLSWWFQLVLCFGTFDIQVRLLITRSACFS